MRRTLFSLILFSLLGGLGLFVLEWLSRKQIDVSRLNREYPVWVKVSEPKGFFEKFQHKTSPHKGSSNKGQISEIDKYHIEWRANRPSHWVNYSEISRYLVGAVIVSEDWNFFSHSGYDPDEIRSAIRVSVEEKRLVRGASTISQQVVKNVFLSNERSLIRKVREISLAIEMSEKVQKRKVLEVYFNIAEMGRGIFGISQASKTYFGKHPSQLNPREAAFIAMLLPSPKKYSQSHRKRELSPYAKRTIHKILRKMLQARYISRTAFVAAWTNPMSFEEKFAATPLPRGFETESAVKATESVSKDGGTEGESSVETPLSQEPSLPDMENETEKDQDSEPNSGSDSELDSEIDVESDAI